MEWNQKDLQKFRPKEIYNITIPKDTNIEITKK